MKILITAVLWIFLQSQACADTFVFGNVSGSWDLAGSPYIVIDDLTVPSGSTLTIAPGVTVTIGDGLGLNVYGRILAAGTKASPIVFQAVNSSLTWTGIYVKKGSSGTASKFEYCDISNATIGIYLHAQGGLGVGSEMKTEVVNSTFKDIVETAIYGNSEAETICTWPPGQTTYHTYLNPRIQNNVIFDSGAGIKFYIHGESHHCGAMASFSSWGAASPRIANNVFAGLTGAALELQTGSYANDSAPIFVNNTIVSSATGVLTKDPYDVRIQNNIFFELNQGVSRLGTDSSLLAYNLFSENQSDLEGYPAAIGTPVIQNRNGIAADIAFNIFENPILEQMNDVQGMSYAVIPHATSAALDAGDNDVDGLPLTDRQRRLRIVSAGGLSEAFVDIGAQEQGPDDFDMDGIPDWSDNCIVNANPDLFDGDSDNFGNVCDGDFNNDDSVNSQDLAILKSAFFTNDAVADLNNDGAVNFVDLGLMKALFFGRPGPSGLVPLQ